MFTSAECQAMAAEKLARARERLATTAADWIEFGRKMSELEAAEVGEKRTVEHDVGRVSWRPRHGPSDHRDRHNPARGIPAGG
jgi:hypothetical protein